MITDSLSKNSRVFFFGLDLREWGRILLIKRKSQDVRLPTRSCFPQLGTTTTYRLIVLLINYGKVGKR